MTPRSRSISRSSKTTTARRQRSEPKRPRKTTVEETQRADPSRETGSPPGRRQANGEGAMTGPRRASRPGEDGEIEQLDHHRRDSASERPVRPRGTAKDRALRLLAVRDRSRREIERRLLSAG